MMFTAFLLKSGGTCPIIPPPMYIYIYIYIWATQLLSMHSPYFRHAA